MVKFSNDGDSTIEINFIGGGEHLLRIQKALILGIETLGSHREHSGYEDHQEAVWILSSLLKQCMLDESQTNIGLGGNGYVSPMNSKLEKDTSSEFLAFMKETNIEGCDDNQLFEKWKALNPGTYHPTKRRFLNWLQILRAQAPHRAA